MMLGLKRLTARARFRDSRQYWESRYAQGGDSGVGSHGRFAEFKADVINHFARMHDIKSMVELGCGDGAQLALAAYPSYVGVDVSPTAIALCRKRFAGDTTKSFLLHDPARPADLWELPTAELGLSLDVIFHLVEDAVFENYMTALFRAATRFVIIYSSDMTGESDSPHVRHRAFTRWVEQRMVEWELLEWIPNRYPYEGDYRTGSFSDFFIYRKAGR